MILYASKVNLQQVSGVHSSPCTPCWPAAAAARAGGPRQWRRRRLRRESSILRCGGAAEHLRALSPQKKGRMLATQRRVWCACESVGRQKADGGSCGVVQGVQESLKTIQSDVYAALANHCALELKRNGVLRRGSSHRSLVNRAAAALAPAAVQLLLATSHICSTALPCRVSSAGMAHPSTPHAAAAKTAQLCCC